MDIKARLIYKAQRNNAFETHLQAYILQNFDKSPLMELLSIQNSEQVWMGNEVSCGVGMQRIDVLIIETVDDATHIRIVELKDEEPYDYIIDSQLPWYLKWVSDYVVPNYSADDKSVYIHPCIIAKSTNNAAILDKITTHIFVDTMSAEICPTEYISFAINNNEIYFKKEI